MVHVRWGSPRLLLVLFACAVALVRGGLSGDPQAVAERASHVSEADELAAAPSAAGESSIFDDISIATVLDVPADQPSVGQAAAADVRAASYGPELTPPVDAMVEKQEAGFAEVSVPPASPAPARRQPIAVANIPSPMRALPADVAEARETIYSDAGRAVALSKTNRRPATRRVDDSWREPETLIGLLRPLAAAGSASKWASEVLQQIGALGTALAHGPDDATAILRRLGRLNQQGERLAAGLSDRAMARKIRQANYAFGRRLDVWHDVARLGPLKPTETPVPDVDRRQLSLCLAEIDSLTAESATGEAWRKYLLLDALQASSRRQAATNDQAAREVAQRVLDRLAQAPLSPSQRKFVATGPVAALRAELRRWAAEPVGAAAVLRDIETYERTGLPSDARRLAVDCQNLAALARRRAGDTWPSASTSITATPTCASP